MSTNRNLVPAMLALLAVSLVACAAEAGKDGAAAEAGEGADVVAYLGGEPISTEDVDGKIRGELIKIRQEEYEARRNAIEQIALEKLIDREAESRDMTREQLFKAEVEDKTPEPTDEMIQQAWDQNKDNPRLEGRTLEELRPAISAQIKRQLVQNRRDAYMQGLLDQADLKVVLEPPRTEVIVPAGEPAKGPEDAPVTLVEFSDFQCPYCKRTQATVDQLLAEFGDKIRFIYRDYALSFHPQAEPAAIAARCAGDQGKYWEYHDNLMKQEGNLTNDDLVKRAETLGLDLAAFNACLESGRHQDAVRAGFDDGSALGVTGTPTFFINGRMMVGAQSYEALKAVIEDEIARASKSS